MRIFLKKPACGECVPLLPEGQRDLRGGTRVGQASDQLDWRNPTLDGTERSHPLPVHFEWMADGMSGPYILHLSIREDFAGERTIVCDEGRAEVYNLLIGQEYFWKVTAGAGVESPVGRFVTGDISPRLIRAEGMTNIRDMGGWKTASGRRIRQGLLFRGSEMDRHHGITEAGKHVLLQELNIRTDLDLRGEVVGEVSCSPLGNTVQFLLHPMRPYAEFFEEGEWEVCRTVFALLADRRNYPIYYHCWGGADRTGTLALLIGGLLGMEDEELMQDYELTSFAIWGKRSRTSDLFISLLEALNGYGRAEEPLRVKAVRFLLKIGVPQAQLDAICEILLED